MIHDNGTAPYTGALFILAHHSYDTEQVYFRLPKFSKLRKSAHVPVEHKVHVEHRDAVEHGIAPPTLS